MPSLATSKRYRAAVIGGSGYGGAELIRRLLIHPDVELVRVASVDFVGEPLSAADPALEQVTALRFEGIPPAEAARDVDVVLLGLPHTVAAAKVPELAALPGVKVVDMSGDFRLKDVEAYQRWYKHVHPCPERLADFVYGLPACPGPRSGACSGTRSGPGASPGPGSCPSARSGGQADPAAPRSEQRDLEAFERLL